MWEFVSKVDKVKRPSASRNTNDNVYVGDYTESSEDDDIYCNDGNDDSDNIELLDEGKGGLQDQHSPQNIRSGRKSQTFPLHTEHMQSNRKAQRLRCDPTNYFIPVPIGPAFPRRDRAESFPKYCCLMLVMFKPWRVVGDLRTPGQTWVNAFDEFMEACNNSIRVVLDNMQVLHECRDAKDVEDRHRRDARRDNMRPGWSKRNGVEQFAGDVFEDDLLDHIDSVVNYASERNSRADAEVLDCLSELEMLGIFSVTKDLWGQTVNAVDPVDDLFLPEDLPLEDMWKTVYDSCRSAWKQKLCNPPESSTVPEQAHNNPTVSNLDAVHAPLVMRLESQPCPPPVNIDEMITK